MPLLTINNYVDKFCFFDTWKNSKVLNAKLTSVIFGKDHKQQICFCKIVFTCFNQLSLDMKAIKILTLLLIQLKKTFQTVCSSVACLDNEFRWKSLLLTSEHLHRVRNILLHRESLGRFRIVLTFRQTCSTEFLREQQ